MYRVELKVWVVRLLTVLFLMYRVELKVGMVKHGELRFLMYRVELKVFSYKSTASSRDILMQKRS
jgi:hypothetical protein